MFLAALAGCCVAVLAGGGCSSAKRPAGGAAPAGAPTVPADPTVAYVSGLEIRASELQKPLMEAHGLNMLLYLVQLKLAEQKAASAGVKVTEADVQAERARTLKGMFQDATEDSYPQLLEQFLNQQRISQPEFDIVIRTSATLRKMAEPQTAGRISEENIQEAFGIMYGEQVVVRHIQVANLQEIGELQRRLQAGERFEDLAVEKSLNRRTGVLGGEMPPFSNKTPNLPEAFKEAAFALKNPGDLSPPVQAQGGYHIIKLERRIPPKAVRYEDVRQSVEAELHERLVSAIVKNYREQLGAEARAGLRIQDPLLQRQFDQRLARHSAAAADREQVRRQIEEDRRAAATQAAAAAATAPATTTEAPQRPPATLPGQ